MAEVIRMPLLSDTMKEGKIISWQKEVGEHVESDDVLAEVETDKAVMEVVGYVDGTLLYRGVPAGEYAQVNEIIAIVGQKGENIETILQSEKSAPISSSNETIESTNPPANLAKSNTVPTAEPKIPGVTVVTMPLLSDTMKEGKIVSWLKEVGEAVSSDDVLAEVETDKATMEVIGYADGSLLYKSVDAGGSVPINDIIAIIGPVGTDISPLVAYYKNKDLNSTPDTELTTQKMSESSNLAQVPAVDGSQANNTINDSRVKASPLARKIAKEKGISLQQVKGTGTDGRIRKKDVENFQPSNVATSNIPSNAISNVDQESYTDIPNSQMRDVIARRLSESKFSAPHYYLTISLQMDNLLAARKQMNATFGVKVSVNDLLVKITAMALRKHPQINSSWMGTFIRQNHHINIGIAVAVEDGLIVPVVKFADKKSLSEIAAESDILIDKAKNKKLQPSEFTGNTFTISNLGMMGIEQFTSIINAPESCIMAVGATVPTPVFDENDQVVKRQIMKVTMSCDHRVVDGATGAAFLQTFKAMIENPLSVLI